MKPENENEIYKQDKYRSMVGKVMYLVNKSNPTSLNTVRELAKHFNNPTKQHWKALTRLIGCIKSDIGKGRILQTPKELRIVAFTDSDYANDEDRNNCGRITYIFYIEDASNSKFIINGSRIYDFRNGNARSSISSANIR